MNPYISLGRLVRCGTINQLCRIKINSPQITFSVARKSNTPARSIAEIENTIAEATSRITNRRHRKAKEAEIREELLPTNKEKVNPDSLFNNMPLPTASNMAYAAWFFSHKAVPADQIVTKRDMLKYSTRLPQVCFLGRSNVGKSSLLNALVGIPRLATVSATPGCTRTINFYNVNNQITLTDLPGFGHAEVSMETYDNWLEIVKIYLKRINISRAFLLIDSRRGLQKIDIETMELFAKHNICFQIVLTKIDELRANEIEALRQKIHSQTAKRPMNFPEVLVSSSKVFFGIDMLRAHILEACGASGNMDPAKLKHK